MAVLPGQLGIGVFSPPLDDRGNSVRGVRACEAISADLGLHFLQPPRASVSTVRARYTLANMRSKRRRNEAERQILDAEGSRAAVWELQGDLHFATIEQVVREIADATGRQKFAVLDFQRVTHADAAATRMIAQLVGLCGARGQQLVLTRVRRGELLANFGAEVEPRYSRSVTFHPQLDLGIEWCERGLLDLYGPARTAAPACTLAEHRLCAGASAADIAFLEQHVEHCCFEAGSMIVRRGERSDALYFLTRGEASVTVDLPGGGQKRLSTLSAGMSFGESALMTGGVRSADVRADTDVECCTLASETFAMLERERPGLIIRLMLNLLQGITATAVQLTGEVAALER
jgi:glutaminase